MIRIEELSYSYPKTGNVLNKISLHLKTPGIYGLLGENGVGKTTLLRLIAGLQKPKEGSIEICNLGGSSQGVNQDTKADIYFLPDTVYAPSMSLEQYAKLYGRFYPNFSLEQMLSNAAEFRVKTKQKINRLSYGQSKKAMISFALATNTKILLLDEPTNGLDISSKLTFRKLLSQSFLEDRLILISTHQVKDVENLIDPIIIMDENDILLSADLETIQKKLFFGLCKDIDLPQTVLYKDVEMGSNYIICGKRELKENGEYSERNINIEYLFSAVINNKNYFKLYR